MSNNVKEIGHKKPHILIFNDTININIFDPNKIKKDEKSYKNILIYYMDM